MNLPTAAHWYQQAADLGGGVAAAQLGLMTLAGEGVPKNPGKALVLLRAAAGKVIVIMVFDGSNGA